MKPNQMLVLLGAVLVMAQLTACHSSTGDEAPALRSVKLTRVGRGNSNGGEVIAILRQEKRADLSFQSEGRVASIVVDVGDQVRAGQVLALLEDRPARLRLEQADARVRGAKAAQDERREQLAQQQAMFDDGAISALTLRSAKLALVIAAADLQSAIAEQGIAQHAADYVAIRAPFDGKVAGRMQQPGATIAAGQTVLQVEGAGRLQAVAALPVSLSSSIKPGQKIDASIGTDRATKVQLTVRSIADRIDAGGTVQGIFDLASDALPLHSNQALLITLVADEPQRILLPSSAVVPGPQAGNGHVFVFHANQSKVERRQVELGEQRGGAIIVNKGLQPGEQVVTAGATFLSDLQQVLPYQSETALIKEMP